MKCPKDKENISCALTDGRKSGIINQKNISRGGKRYEKAARERGRLWQFTTTRRLTENWASAREDLSEERVLEMLRLLSETSEEAEETEKRNVGTIEKTDRESIDQFAEKRDREPDRPTHRKGKPYSHKSARRACAVGRKRRGEARFRWSARAVDQPPSAR